ncbi:hypothetical protein KM043_016555 [Ampulex compressa]|nr:hypothetical protein KM043_016555 [Ampulex compressa]
MRRAAVPEKEEKVEEVEKAGKGWKGRKATNVGGKRGKEDEARGRMERAAGVKEESESEEIDVCRRAARYSPSNSLLHLFPKPSIASRASRSLPKEQSGQRSAAFHRWSTRVSTGCEPEAAAASVAHPAGTYRETFKPTFPSWLAFKIRVERHALAGRELPAGDLPACHLAGYPGTSMPGHANTSA